MIIDMKKRLFNLSSKLFLGLYATLYGNTTFAAVVGGKDSVQGYLVLILIFVNNVILPLLFSIALLFFLINAVRYFILGSSQSENQEKAKTMALYGIGAFVVMVSIWGIVNLLTSGLNINNDNAMCPDYLGNNCGNSGGFGNNFFNFESGVGVHFQFSL